MLSKDKEIIDYFLSLKQKYANDRQPYETNWKAAWDLYLNNENVEKVYSGKTSLKIPISKWKVNGMLARIMRIIFNAEPFARIEKLKSKPLSKNFVDLWNKYIFQYQLEVIGFKQAYKVFTKNKTIQGTAFAKIPQEFQTSKFSYFEDEDEEVVIKDNPYFRPILITEFYSDVNCPNINDSAACIHSTTLAVEDIYKNRKREVTEYVEIKDEMGNVVAVKEKTKKVGLYENVELLFPESYELSEEQIEWMQQIGLNTSGQTKYQETLENMKKTGIIRIDECYGKYDLDGDGFAEECIFVIAEGMILLRKEPTTFRHKRFIRPFIRGVYEEIPNCLYGTSNVIIGMTLSQELNASRAQANDAKTYSIFPMIYEDISKSMNWDGEWAPLKRIKGNGPLGIQQIVNPNLSNVAINDSQLVQRDIDQLWSLSPVQEGTSDNRLIPQTATGTSALISQNDMQLNDIIDTAIENEIKPFLEMIFERNLTFKTPQDLLIVWDEEDVKKAGINVDETGNIQMNMKALYFEPLIKVLGTLELNNEVVRQNGLISFSQVANSNPNIASRVDPTALAEALLREFGLKDISEQILYDEATFQNAQQAQQQKQQEQLRQQEELKRMNLQEAIQADLTSHKAKKEIDTEADIVKMQSEASIESISGKKVM